MHDKGVKFYSSSDLACGYNLEKAETVLEEYDESYKYEDINIILEFYNIQLYLSNQCYLIRWNETTINAYQNASKSFDKQIGLYFSSIDDTNIINIYKEIQNEYYDDFWTLFKKYKLYNKISKEIFEIILRERLDLQYILVHKIIVQKYDQIISNIIMEDIQNCEVLLDEYLVFKNTDKKYYFPNSLNKTKLVEMYVDSEVANLNYLELIVKSLSTNDLKLSDKLRLKAKKRYEKDMKKILKKGTFMSYGVKLSFSDIQRQPVNIEFKDHNLIFTYSKKWFKENLDYPILLIYNFIHNFMFVDNQIRFLHVHKLNSMSVIRKCLGIKGKNEYITDTVFEQLNMSAQLQIQAYYAFLNNESIKLEALYKWFFEDYLKTEFNVIGFYFNCPSTNASYLEKNRTLNSEIDSVLKQFKMWCEDRNIDLELLQMSSNHMLFKDLPSLIDKKYIYPNSEEFNIASYLLCSNQSPIHYISKKYNQSNFYELINKNDLKIEDFHEYQHKDVKWLLDHYYIYTNIDGFLKNDIDVIWIINELYLNDVLSYHHLDKNKQKTVDILLEKKILKYENTLFSKPEYDYFNYIFNKSDFTNGLDIRNKYIHGTQSMDENVQKNDYYIILRMLVLCILKINDEFCLEYEIRNCGK